MISEHRFHMTCKWLDVKYNRKAGVSSEGEVSGPTLPFDPCLL